MGHQTTGPGYRTDTFVRDDGQMMVETIYDQAGNIVSHRSAEPDGPGLQPLRADDLEAAIRASLGEPPTAEEQRWIDLAPLWGISPADLMRAERHAGKPLETCDWRVVAESLAYAVQCRPIAESGLSAVEIENAIRAGLDSAKFEALSSAIEQALEHAAERAGATDAGAREAEDRMDAYLALLDRGVRPAEVLCRAAMRRLPPAQFYGATATWLEARGGLTMREHKHARKTVKRWVEDGLAVPTHCWALLLSAIPASVLKERLSDLGGRQ
jgi:hypothetical protein